MKLTESEHDILVDIFARNQIERAQSATDMAKNAAILSLAEKLGVEAMEIIIRVLEIINEADGEIVVEGGMME